MCIRDSTNPLSENVGIFTEKTYPTIKNTHPLSENAFTEDTHLTTENTHFTPENTHPFHENVGLSVKMPTLKTLTSQLKTPP